MPVSSSKDAVALQNEAGLDRREGRGKSSGRAVAHAAIRHFSRWIASYLVSSSRDSRTRTFVQSTSIARHEEIVAGLGDWLIEVNKECQLLIRTARHFSCCCVSSHFLFEFRVNRVRP